MTKSVIAEGKTSNEAINNGLKQLGCKLEDVDVKVLENEDKKVFFSILDPRVVKVELTLKEGKEIKRDREFKPASEEDIKKATEMVENFMNEFVKPFDQVVYEMKVKDGGIFINISGKNCSRFIGYRGETINALQTILKSVANKETDELVRVLVDVCRYKRKREDTLNQLAKKLEGSVSRNKRKIILEPMNAYERKIIHTALQNSKVVTTYSIGEEPKRKVVVDIK